MAVISESMHHDTSVSTVEMGNILLEINWLFLEFEKWQAVGMLAPITALCSSVVFASISLTHFLSNNLQNLEKL